MKIALCLEYPIEQHGGVEVLVSELIKGLAPRHQIWLVSADSEASAKKSSVGNLIAGHFPWDPVTASVRQARALARTLADANIELAHFHLGGNYGWNNRNCFRSPIVHVARHGIRCLSTNHGAFSITDGYCGDHRPLLKATYFLPAWLSKQVVLAHLRCEVLVSQHDYHAVRRWYPPLRGKFRWIYHSRLHGTPPGQNGSREKIILCAGTIGPRKNQPLLANAFARIAKGFPDWQLVFVGRYGDNDSLRQVREIIARQKLEKQVHLLGARPDSELRDWLQRSAIFAMPSVYEGLGLSLQEAQFYGCACVATRCGGTADLIDDGDNGFLVPGGRPDPLAEALEKLMQDAPLRQRFSQRAPQSILEKKMTAPQMVDAYEKLYSDLLTRR